MKKFIEENKLPVIISLVALVVATVIGLVPVRQSAQTAADREIRQSRDLSDRIAALESAMAAVQANPPAAAPSAGAESGAGADNPELARIRQELSLISRGLLVQTGRVAGVKDTLSALTDAAGNPAIAPRLTQEIALINKGLANLTRRINELDDRTDALEHLPAAVDRLGLQMANVDRALANLARRANAQGDSLDQSAHLPGDVTRLTLQMANVDRAFLKVKRALKDAALDREALQAALAQAQLSSLASGGDTAAASAQLSEIEQKLDRILGALSDG